MADIVQNAGQAVVDAATNIILGAVDGVTIECQIGTTDDLEINIPGLHAADEWFVLTEGDKQTFRKSGRGLRTVTVRPVGADAAVNWGAAKQAPRYSS